MTLEEFEKVEKDVMDKNIHSSEHKAMDWMIDGLKKHYEEQDLKDILKEVHQEATDGSSEKKVTKTGIRRLTNINLVTRIAAAVLIFAIPWMILQNYNKESDLYSQYYTTYANLMTTRSTDSDEALKRAGKAYSGGNFELVIFELESVDSEQASFYRAVSLMELGKYDQALLAWQNHLREYKYLNRVSKFNLALVYIKMEQSSAAIKILSELEYEKDKIGENAKALLLSLKK